MEEAGKSPSMKQLIMDDTIVVENHLTGKVEVRSGGCTKGCGACCEYMIIPLHQGLLKAPAERLTDYILWAKYHGVIIYESYGELVAKIPLACEKLETDEDGDKVCGVFGTPERPNLCARTPRVQLDIEGLEEVCSYEWN